MIKYSLSILMISLGLSSCRDTTKHNQTLIVGEWEAMDKNSLSVYVFEEDGICRKDPGFFAYEDTAKATFTNFAISGGKEGVDLSVVVNNTLHYYRNHSCYRIERNCLSIYDPVLEGWDRHYIRFISPDILVLSDKDRTRQAYYARKQKKEIDTSPLFDQILIYYPPTSFLPRRYASFYRNGRMVAYGYNGFPENCTFAAISENDFIQLEASFKQANIQKYLEQLGKRDEGMFLPESPAILFVRDNHMYSFYNDFSILDSTDYKRFFRAYCNALFYVENLQYCPDIYIAADEILYDFDDIRLCGVYFNGREIKLTEPEYYYLALLLRDAPQADHTFVPTFLFKDSSNKVRILTDGQHFTFWVPIGKKTVDIGFNFMEKYDFQKYSPHPDSYGK